MKRSHHQTGFIFGWLQGQDLEECGFVGDLVARFALMKTGARQGLPTRSELVSVYREVSAEELYLLLRLLC